MARDDDNKRPLPEYRPGRGIAPVPAGEPHPLAAATRDLIDSAETALAAVRRLDNDLCRFLTVLRVWGGPASLAEAPARPPVK